MEINKKLIFAINKENDDSWIDNKLKEFEISEEYLIHLFDIFISIDTEKELKSKFFIILNEKLKNIKNDNIKQFNKFYPHFLNNYFKIDDIFIIKDIAKLSIKFLIQLSDQETDSLFLKSKEILNFILINNSLDFNKISNILILFDSLCKIYQFNNIRKDRLINNKFSSKFFPFFELAIQYINNNSPNYHYFYLIYKIIYKLGKLGILKYLIYDDKQNFLFKSMLKFIENHKNLLNNTNTDRYIIKTVGVVFKIYIQFINFTNLNLPEIKFIENLKLNFLNILFKITINILKITNILENNKKIIYILLRVLWYNIKLFKANKIKFNNNNDLVILLKTKLFEYILITQKDIDFFKKFPLKYFKKDLNYDFNFNKIIFIIYNEALTIKNSRKEILNHFFKTANNYINLKNYLGLEAIFNLFQNIGNHIKILPRNFLNNDIFKSIKFCFESNNEILIYRILSLINYLKKNDILQTYINKDIIEIIINLLSSSILPIQWQSALFFQNFVESDIESILPFSNSIILIFINLIICIEHNIVFKCFNKLIIYLKECISNNGYQIIQTLCGLVNNFYDKLKYNQYHNNVNFEEYDYSIYGVYNTINEIVSLIKNKDLLVKIENEVWMSLLKVIEEKDIEMVNEGLKVVKNIIFRSKIKHYDYLFYYEICCKFIYTNIYPKLSDKDTNNSRLMQLNNFDTQCEELWINSWNIIDYFIKKYGKNLLMINNHWGENYVSLIINVMLLNLEDLDNKNIFEFNNIIILYLLQILYEYRNHQLEEKIMDKILYYLLVIQLNKKLIKWDLIYSCILLIFYQNENLVIHFLTKYKLLDIFKKYWIHLIENCKIYKFQKIAVLTYIKFIDKKFFKYFDYQYMFLLNNYIFNNLKKIFDSKLEFLNNNLFEGIDNNLDNLDDNFNEDFLENNQLFNEYDDYSHNLEFYNLDEISQFKQKINQIKVVNLEFYNKLISSSTVENLSILNIKI